MTKMKIAIVGAGFCGLASAYHLLNLPHSPFQVALFDPAEIGDNASGIAAGLLHLYHGAQAKLSPRGKEGMAATLDIARAVEKESSGEILRLSGMLRVATSPQQVSDFKQCAALHAEVRWLESGACVEKVPGLKPNPGLFISEAYVVNTKEYLRGLARFCLERGLVWHKQEIRSIQELAEYDAVVLAAGAGIVEIEEARALLIHRIKGQVLKFKWPAELPPLPLPLNSKAYIVPEKDGLSCIAGATFERKFTHPHPDAVLALSLLKDKFTDLIPDLAAGELISCHAGIRASGPQHLPLACKLTDKVWVISGMGSRGLLYHALYARDLVADIVSTLYVF